jgi:type I restriction enzyme S subunit
MNAERLLAQFERISDAPDAIPRLRRFILDLAVRGKLVEQDPEDEPAEELFCRYLERRMDLASQGKIRRPKPSSPVRDEETPINLPFGWAWVRLNEIGSLSGGMTPSMGRPDYWDGHITWLSPKDIKRDEVVESELRLSGLGLSESRLELYPPGCLFIVARSGILKRTLPVSINRVPAAANQDMKVLSPYVDGQERYLQVMLRGLTDYILTSLVKTGTTVQSLKYGEFAEQPFPLPPLAEQHRIIAKVDELMALCDQLEAARQKREQGRERLVAATLQRLNQPAEDLASFRQDASFALQVLPSLTTTPAQIKQLRQTILNLAVRGKLVEQDPEDEPVEGYLKLIKAQPANQGDFGIPRQWNSVSVGEVSSSRLGKMLDKAKNKGTERPHLRNINVRWLDFDLSDLLEMRFEDSELSEYELRKGDVLICEGGEPGRAAVWDGRARGVYFQKAIHRVRFDECVDPFFFVHTLRCSALDERLSKYFTGTGICHFTGKSLKAYLFPLPPLAEQHSIVAMVDELMALCDPAGAAAQPGRSAAQAVAGGGVGGGVRRQTDRRGGKPCSHRLRIHR